MVDKNNTHINEFIINNDTFNLYVKNIIQKIKKFDFKYVYAIPKGGLYLGTILSNVFNVPLLNSHEFILSNKDDKILIVDDICDTGKTLEVHNNKTPFPFITLVAKKAGVKKINNLIFEYLVSDDTWVIFPWEQFKIGKTE